MITEREKKLWDLLDDIDSASDLFRPDLSPYVQYVLKKSAERHKFLKSDGYDLTEWT